MMWGFHGVLGSGAGLFPGGLMMLFWPVVLVMLLVVFMRFVRGGGAHCCGAMAQPPRSQQNRAGDEAGEIARHRYAQGEITRDEYLDILRTLGL